MKEIVKTEVLKLLKAIIFTLSLIVDVLAISMLYLRREECPLSRVKRVI